MSLPDCETTSVVHTATVIAGRSLALMAATDLIVICKFVLIDLRLTAPEVSRYGRNAFSA